jgi:hypothetical protein
VLKCRYRNSVEASEWDDRRVANYCHRSAAIALEQVAYARQQIAESRRLLTLATLTEAANETKRTDAA